jgi:hypothetical protein
VSNEKEYEVNVDSTAVLIAETEEEAETKALDGEYVDINHVEAESQGERDV